MSDEANQPRSTVPAAVWHWICTEVGETGARSMDPLVGAVLAAARVTKRGEAASTPPEVLRYWAWHLDSARRVVHQNEREFLRLARAAGWSDDEIRRWALLNGEIDVDEHVGELDALVHRTDRPPTPRAKPPALQ